MWIEKTPNGKFKFCERYKCPKTNKVKKVSVTLTTDTKQAQKKASALLHNKIEVAKNKTDAKTALLNGVINEFLADKALHLKHTSLLSYKSLIKHIISHLPNDFILSDLDVRKTEAILNDTVSKKSFSYARIVFNLIKQIYKYALRHNYIDDITFLDSVVLREPPKTHAQLDKINTKFLNKNELSNVLNQLMEINEDIGKACEFLVLTGLRVGELSALTIDNYDPIGRCIKVTGTLYNGTKTTPKNVYSYRTVTLTDKAIKIIEYFIERNNTSLKPTKFIFNTSKVKINKALRIVDFDRHLTSHIFRHTHISLLTEMGVPIKTIMKRVGHNSPQTTLSIYTHVTDNMEADMLKKLENI